MTPLAGWENFYVIVGSSAGALIGLQFVVITLIADLPVARGPVQAQASNAFATPTVVHFSAVLLLAAVACAPWHGATGPGSLWGVLGLAGIVYEVIVIRRMRTQPLYKPQFEDWLFHAVLPFVAYLVLATSAWISGIHLEVALFTVGATALLLLFIGIHNAWDAVTYHVYFTRRAQQGESSHC